MDTQNLPPASPVRAKVIRVGNSVGVRFPASLHLEVGTEVEVTVRRLDVWPEGYFDLEAVGDAFQVPERDSGVAHDKRLKRLFGPKGSL